MTEGLAVATNHGRPCAFGKRELPGIIFTKARAVFACTPLQFGALGGVLEADVLRYVTRNKLQANVWIAAALQEFGNGDATDEERALSQATIPPKPGHGRAGHAGLYLTFEINQERGIKQRGSHGVPFVRRSWQVLIRPNQQVRGSSRPCQETGHGSARTGTLGIAWRWHRAASILQPYTGWKWGILSWRGHGKFNYDRSQTRP
jgi:hypothetical protein